MAEGPDSYDSEATEYQTAEAAAVQTSWDDKLLHLAGDQEFREWLHYLLYSACKMMNSDTMMNRQLADEAKGRADLARDIHETLFKGNRRAFYAMLEENDPEGSDNR